MPCETCGYDKVGYGRPHSCVDHLKKRAETAEVDRDQWRTSSLNERALRHKAETEAKKASDCLHEIETTTTALAVQDAAAWRERAIVAETALASQVKELEDRIGTFHRSADAAGIVLGDDPDYSVCKAFARLLKLETALRRLLTQMGNTFASPKYMSVWVLAEKHQGPYDGPTFSQEYLKGWEALRETDEGA